MLLVAMSQTAVAEGTTGTRKLLSNKPVISFSKGGMSYWQAPSPPSASSSPSKPASSPSPSPPSPPSPYGQYWKSVSVKAGKKL
eukprot:jgi/Chrzof1/8422/Cz03g10040.t1